jgi:cell division septal protein FtsQ
MLSWESDYMVLFNEKKFSQTIADKYNDLAGVEIEKTWPDRLKIVLIPEIAKIIWKTEGKLYLVNASGVVLGLIEEPERLAKFNDLPVITDNSNLPVEDGNKVVSRDFVTFIDMAKSSIDMSVKKDIESYEVEETTFNLKIKFKEGFWAYFDTLRNAELQVEKLAVFLNQGKLVDQYVDLRVPGKIFYQ